MRLSSLIVLWLTVLATLPTSAQQIDEAFFDEPYIQDYKDIFCEELWFSRNATLNHLGQCFSSPLGQAVFDNSDCTTDRIDIGAREAERIKYYRRLEARLECNVDTSRDTLFSVSDIGLRLKLTVQPSTLVPSEAEYSCLNYIGPALQARSAPDQGADILYTVESNDDLDFNFGHAEDGWALTGIRSAQQRDWHLGWIYFSPDIKIEPVEMGGVCKDIAG